MDAVGVETAGPKAGRLVELKARLLEMRRALQNDGAAEAQELATPAGDRGEDTTPSQHPADVASDLEAREFVLTRRLIDARELEDVESALARIEAGTYGLCVDCGRPIQDERLEVRPQAARDIDCLRRVMRAAALQRGR